MTTHPALTVFSEKRQAAAMLTKVNEESEATKYSDGTQAFWECEAMDDAIRNTILNVLKEHRIMTIATLQADGWPQATTVGYGNDGLNLYFCCARGGQKAKNLARDDRVSLAINNDPDQVMEILGLTMAARAEAVDDADELAKANELLQEKYPWQEGTPAPSPPPEVTRVFRVIPELITVLDYSKGFAHIDRVDCQPQDA